MTAALSTNAYWDAVKDRVKPGDYPWEPDGLTIGGFKDPDYVEAFSLRRDLCSRYSWTITAPATVAFVAEHAGPQVIDPMAGTGWWAHLLTEAGCDVAAFDLNPPGSDANHWHQDPTTYHPITTFDGAQAVRDHGAGRTLLLSWPPYSDPAGADVLAAYLGDRVIFIGEGPGGCTGDDRVFELLESDWTEAAAHRPVQWYGIHDWITVYDRKPSAPKESA